jgi:hypothetical protein
MSNETIKPRLVNREDSYSQYILDCELDPSVCLANKLARESDNQAKDADYLQAGLNPISCDNKAILVLTTGKIHVDILRSRSILCGIRDAEIEQKLEDLD